MITLPEVQLMLASSGIAVSVPTLRRWARRGVFGGIMGRRDKRYMMRASEVRRVTHGIRPDDWQRNGVTLRLAPVSQ